MADQFGSEHSQRKADFVADVVNRTLHDLAIRCTKTEEVRNYYYISIIGYGSSVGPAFSGNLAGKALVPVFRGGGTSCSYREPYETGGRWRWRVSRDSGSFSCLDGSDL